MDEERNYWQRTMGRRISRRTALRGAGVGVAGVAGAVLIGCGDDDDDTGAAAPKPAATAAAQATAAATAAAQATAAATEAPVAFKRGGTWKGQTGGDPPTIDPYGNLSYQTKGFAAYHYSRLWKRDTKPWPFNGNGTGVIPDIAESTETSDGITWVTKLRPGVKMQNVAPVSGREVTTEDVKFSWDRLTSAQAAGSDFVAHVESMEVIDDRTVKHTLKAVSPVWLETLADPNVLFIMPTESDGGFDPATTAIGSGPWILDAYRPAESFLRDRNPDWYEKAADGKSYPLLDRHEWVVLPEYQNQLAQMEAGNIYATGIRSDDVLSVKERHSDFQWFGDLSELQSLVYFSNIPTTDKAWGDERVRQAVSMMLDRDGLLDLAYNVKKLREAGLDASAAWNNIVPAGMKKWWLDPQSPEHGASGKFFNFDLNEAKKLLQAAGYGDGFDFVYHYTNRYGSTFVSVAEATFNMFANAGLKPETAVEDYSAKYITQTFRGNFEGIAFGYETPFPEVGSYFPRMFGQDPPNKGHVSDPVIDDLAAKQAKELDEEKRREFIFDIQRRNAEKMWYVPHPQGGGTGFSAWAGFVRGQRDTKSYGAGTEVAPFLWLDL